MGWINIYFGSPDFITADASRQFIAKEFKQYTTNMSIIIKNTLVETHYSISMVKRYHGLLQQVYSIVTIKIPGIKPDLAFQISFKAINDSISPNELVLILLVFGIYPKMTELDTLSPSII